AHHPTDSHQQKEKHRNRTTTPSNQGGEAESCQQADRRREMLCHAGTAAVRISAQYSRRERQEKWSGEQEQHLAPSAGPENATSEQTTENRQKAGTALPAEWIGEEIARVNRQQPARKL